MQKYKYAVQGENEDMFFTFETDWIEWTRMLTDAAKDYFYDLEGDEDDWPLVFILAELDGKEICRGRVELDTNPSFTAFTV